MNTDKKSYENILSPSSISPSPILIEGHDAKIFTRNIEESALKQVKRLLDIDVFADKKIRIMPDVHAGAGCVIGFTGDLGDKVIPNIVGVDIGCGMRVLRLEGVSRIDYHAFHQHIERNVPSGMACRDERKGFRQLAGAEMELYQQAKEEMNSLYCLRSLKDTGHIKRSIGTLGGGNHFIELDTDPAGHIYLVIHTGSRNLGKQVADLYQRRAIGHLTEGYDEFEDDIRRLIEEYKAAGRRKEIQGEILRRRHNHEVKEPLLPAELCYLEGEAREEYLHDMRICQRWAVINRRLIAMLLLEFFPQVSVAEEFESIHNYISDDNMIRKGAISAAAGERCIIPLNMRDGSLICTGKGNPDWNFSAPHGAGRVLSRSQAYRTITMDDFKASMRGVYSESISDYTRDESPMVYKPAGEIIRGIGDTVDIDAIIRPLFNFKASK